MKRQLAQVVIALDEDVEGAKLGLVVVLARVERVEVGDAVEPEDDDLAVDDKTLLSVLPCGLDNPGKAFGPIVTAAGDQPNAITIALDTGPAWPGERSNRGCDLVRPVVPGKGQVVSN
jgi:hypothetical protein